jgi:hypothetical protein
MRGDAPFASGEARFVARKLMRRPRAVSGPSAALSELGNELVFHCGEAARLRRGRRFGVFFDHSNARLLAKLFFVTHGSPPLMPCSAFGIVKQ